MHSPLFKTHCHIYFATRTHVPFNEPTQEDGLSALFLRVSLAHPNIITSLTADNTNLRIKILAKELLVFGRS